MTRARGDGFFAAMETAPREPRGVLVGQHTGASCAAACCRMLLLDSLQGAEDSLLFSESFLRAALATNSRGTVIARIPEVLHEIGLPAMYHYRQDLVIGELQKAVKAIPAIALVRASGDDEFHALIVEGIKGQSVDIRDPLPEGIGSAYRISLALFLSVWAGKKSGCGRAIVVVE